MKCPYCQKILDGRARPQRPFDPDKFQVTSEMLDWAQKQVKGLDVSWETQKFKDYWLSDGGTKADWIAAWRTWLRRAYERK